MFYLILSLFIIIFSVYQWKTYSYWRKRGIPGPTPIPIFGNYAQIVLRMKSEIEYLTDVYHKYSDVKCIGIYIGMKPALLLKDPKMITQIFAKDSNNFKARFITETSKQFYKSVFLDGGDRLLIKNSTAYFFTKLQLKKITELIETPLEAYTDFLEESTKVTENIEMYSSLQSCTRAITWNVTMGLENFEFTGNDTIEKMVIISNRVENFRLSRFIHGFPVIAKIITPFLRIVLHFVKFRLVKFITQIIQAQEKLSKNNTFLHTLLQIKHENEKDLNSKKLEMTVDDVFIAINIFTAIAGTIVTIPVALTALMYELAKNPELQDKCYDSIQEVNSDVHEKRLTWELVSKMTFLEMAVKEIIRKYSSLVIDRECTSTYQYPGTDLKIDKGVNILVALLTMHNDPKYFDNPHVFDPERFSKDNIQNIDPGVYLPFGIGPRICFGQHFAMMTMMMAVAAILNKFKFSLCDLSVDKVKTDPSIRVNTLLGDIWLKLEKRDRVENKQSH